MRLPLRSGRPQSGAGCPFEHSSQLSWISCPCWGKVAQRCGPRQSPAPFLGTQGGALGIETGAGGLAGRPGGGAEPPPPPPVHDRLSGARGLFWQTSGRSGPSGGEGVLPMPAQAP